MGGAGHWNVDIQSSMAETGKSQRELCFEYVLTLFSVCVRLLAIQNGKYFASSGDLLLTIRPDREEKLSELYVVRLSLPEDIEKLKSQNKRDKNIQDR